MPRTYALTEKGLGLQMTNQQGIIHQALHDGPKTVKQIADAVSSELITKQPATKVVGFYMSTWKGLGYVHVVDGMPGNSVAELPPVVDTPVSTENHSEIAEVSLSDVTIPALPDNVTNEWREGFETKTDYILRQIAVRGIPVQPVQIESFSLGTIKKKDAADTMRRLAQQGKLVKTDDGYVVVE